MDIFEIYKDKTAISPKNIEHQVVSLTKDCFGEIKDVKFHSGLSIGILPLDGEWSISWEQFHKEFMLVLSKQEAIEQHRFL